MDVVRCSRQLGSASPGGRLDGAQGRGAAGVCSPRQHAKQQACAANGRGLVPMSTGAQEEVSFPKPAFTSFSVPRSGFSFLLKRPKRTVLKRGMVVMGFSMMPDERRREETGENRRESKFPSAHFSLLPLTGRFTSLAFSGEEMRIGNSESPVKFLWRRMAR